MFAAGSKRKCCEPEEGADGALASLRAVPSYALQRQLLLDMSLVKLQLCHMLAEPRLCRSVLIANTVRQIQEEMAQDGTWRLLPPPSMGPAPLDRLVSTDVLCRAAAGPGPEGSGLPRDLEGEQARELVSEHSTSAQESRGPQSGAWEGDSPQDSRGHFPKSLDHLLETLDGRAAGSAEDLFADVDSSYYDLDSVLAGVMSGTRPAPCDVLDSLGPPAATTPSTSCKPDLGELEHVVGILVES